ncbi:MAG TPA: helix-turn-helix domain-containing protein, partial [Terriglobales bacterium]|nr:helix-turn-helix domain-containing protein [Terriglobales bacterium]
GQLITREQIAEKLWGNHVFVDVEQGINTAIRKVRRALNDDSAQPQLLQTVVGRGYRFVGLSDEPQPSEPNHTVFSAEDLGRAIRAAAGLHEEDKKTD